MRSNINWSFRLFFIVTIFFFISTLVFMYLPEDKLLSFRYWLRSLLGKLIRKWANNESPATLAQREDAYNNIIDSMTKSASIIEKFCVLHIGNLPYKMTETASGGWKITLPMRGTGKLTHGEKDLLFNALNDYLIRSSAPSPALKSVREAGKGVEFIFTIFTEQSKLDKFCAEWNTPPEDESWRNIPIFKTEEDNDDTMLL